VLHLRQSEYILIIYKIETAYCTARWGPSIELEMCTFWSLNEKLGEAEEPNQPVQRSIIAK
jgi:hypothetical protein